MRDNYEFRRIDRDGCWTSFRRHIMLRREFLFYTGSRIAGATILIACIRDDQVASVPSLRPNNSPRIKSAVRPEETTFRLGGHGAEWHMSWADDDPGRAGFF